MRIYQSAFVSVGHCYLALARISPTAATAATPPQNLSCGLVGLPVLIYEQMCSQFGPRVRFTTSLVTTSWARDCTWVCDCQSSGPRSPTISCSQFGIDCR